MFYKKLPDDYSLPTPEDSLDKEIIGKINDIGWYKLHIQGDSESPAFAFTIGHFFKYDHPEIIVIGLPQKTADQLLDIAAIKIAGARDTIIPFKEYTDFTENLSVAFIPVDIDYYGEYLGYANWYYQSLSKPYPALQMVWPDREGKFPWENGYDKRFNRLQPLLGSYIR